MGSGHASTSYTSTLSGTVADRVTLDQIWSIIRVTNSDPTHTLWIRQDGTTTPPDAVASGVGCLSIAPSSYLDTVGVPTPDNTLVISVVGNGGSYAITGISPGSAADVVDGIWVPVTGATSIEFVSGNGDVLKTFAHDGLNGPEFQILSETAGKAANLVIVPHATASESGNTSQILLYGKSGDDYNRFGISNNNGAVVMDLTYNGAGANRPFVLQAGGSVSNSITSQTALKVWPDASIDLLGAANFTAGGRSGWASQGTRLVDPANTGSVRLILDTRTGTPASNVADSSLFELRRGGARKWLFGLNANGGNVDSFDFVGPSSFFALSVFAAGGLSIRSDSTNANPSLVLINTAASGHSWRIGEINGVGRLGFRDITASGAPILVEFDGTAKAIRFNDPCDFMFGTSTGTILGTTTAQKFAFHGATPVIQRAGAAQVAVVTTASTQTTPWGFATQAQADAIVTLVNELRAAVVEKGLIKGAA